LNTFQSHFISYEAYQAIKDNDFEKFLEERYKKIRTIIGKKIGADEEPAVPLHNAIGSCSKYIYLIDKYFAPNDLDILIDGIAKTDIKEVKTYSRS
jgi:hypothetical protein